MTLRYLLATALRRSVTVTDGEHRSELLVAEDVFNVTMTLTARLADIFPGYLDFEMEVREVHKFSVIATA